MLRTASRMFKVRIMSGFAALHKIIKCDRTPKPLIPIFSGQNHLKIFVIYLYIVK
jgi:hypothetical protein